MMTSSELGSVHNYFERLVFTEINESYLNKNLSDQDIADMACIALNHIPPKYIRFDIDTSFFMTPEDYWTNQNKVKQALETAYKVVSTK